MTVTEIKSKTDEVLKGKYRSFDSNRGIAFYGLSLTFRVDIFDKNALVVEFGEIGKASEKIMPEDSDVIWIDEYANEDDVLKAILDEIERNDIREE